MSDFLDQHAGQGMQNVSMDDMTVPFIKILQPLSPEVEEDSGVSGAKPGLFYNTQTKKLYKTLKFLPLFFMKEWLEWRPERGGFAGKHLPGSIDINTSDFSNWIRPDTGNTIQETFTFIGFLADNMDAGPVFLSLTSTGIKPAKMLNTAIFTRKLPNGKQQPFWGTVWELVTKKYKNDKGSWYMIGDKKELNATPIRFVEESEYVEYIEPALRTVEQLRLDYDTIQGEAEALPAPSNTIEGKVEAPY